MLRRSLRVKTWQNQLSVWRTGQWPDGRAEVRANSFGCRDTDSGPGLLPDPLAGSGSVLGLRVGGKVPQCP